MSRFLVLMLCALVVLSLGTNAAAHATETTVCVESVSGHAGVHSDGQDQGKQGSDKGVAHQHGCHGHHFVALPPERAIAGHDLPSAAPVAGLTPSLHAAASHPALRPPQA